MKNKVFIRVDGNEIIASGHVMRCLSIAAQIRKLGAEAVFITADHNPQPVIVEAGFTCKVLDSDYSRLESEIDRMRELLAVEKAKVLLVDSYFVTKTYFSRLADLVKIVYIDDFLNTPYSVSGLIHYSVFEGKERANALYRALPRPKLLFGGMYAPLREEFSNSNMVIRQQVRTVLITTGGADRLGMSIHLLEKLKEQSYFNEITVRIISGRFNQNLEQLNKIAEGLGNVEILVNVRNMAERMMESDVVISASGTTLYELAAVGVPSICFEVADNQKGAEIWEKEGLMLYGGNAEIDLSACLRNCIKHLETYINHYEERFGRSQKMRTLVDGKGAMRIAAYLTEWN